MIVQYLRQLSERGSNESSHQRNIRLFGSDRTHDRAAMNIVVEYVFAIGLFIALSGLLTAGFSSTIQTSQENVAQVELDQATAELAVAIEDVDRMANEGMEDVQIRVELPDEVGSVPYIIRVSAADETVTGETSIASGDSAESTVEYDVAQDVDGVGGFSGGTVIVSYDGDEIEVERL